MTEQEQQKIQALNLEDPKDFAQAVCVFLDSKRGKNIVTIDLKNKSILADYFVICSASSTTQVRALAETVDEEMGKLGYDILHRDIDSHWSALDYGDVIVHVLYTETRAFYDIERLWSDGDNVTVYLGDE